MPIALCLPPCSWKKRGLEGIYSYSLFHYDARMEDILTHGIELGRSFIQPRYWGVAGWIICGAASGPGWRATRTIAICSARSPFPVACRPRLAICWWHSTVRGSRRRIRWRNPVARILPHCRMCWRSLAGKITTTTWRG